MNGDVLSTKQINKTFRGFTALKDVSISVEKGKIYGLIGKNGAGKTTLMRIITGLSIPSAGGYELFGYSDQGNIQKALKKVGSLIEYPKLNEHMSAKENLKLHRVLRGNKDGASDDDLLKLVGLYETGKKKIKDFSLGMVQRLGIAVSLLGNPELLILDEPVNGLDPLGVVEIRNLIKQLSEEHGYTILISSHNLSELYQTATDYIIIDNGEVKKTISLKELEHECQYYVSIQTKQMNALKKMLEEEMHTTNYETISGETLKLFDFVNELDVLAKALFSNGIIVTKFAVEGESLESYFTHLVGGDE